jgi:hypothetical protein
MPLTDVFAPLNSAIALGKEIRGIADKAKNAELHHRVSDLMLQLADAQMRLADVIAENAMLKTKLHAAEAPVLDRCPACGRNTFAVVSSKPDRDFGDMGVSNRVYKCTSCSFTEPKSVH